MARKHRNSEYIELSLYDPGTSVVKDRISHGKLTESQLRTVLIRLGAVTDSDVAINFEKVLLQNVRYMVQKVEEMETSDAIRILRDAITEHREDVNFRREDYNIIQDLIRRIPNEVEDVVTPSSGQDLGEVKAETIRKDNEENIISEKTDDWELLVKLEAVLIAFHSPYPEIRAITDPTDDPTIPAETFRVYVISLFWTLIGSIINTIFVHRLPSISVGTSTIQILILPSAKLWERFVPNKTIKAFGRVINLNPGEWTYKEMMLSTIIYLCSSGAPYLIYNIVVMKLERFYGLKWVSWGFQLLLTLSTQCLGFGLAGVMRKVCIYPSKALWPTILPTIALNRALMKSDAHDLPINGWKVTRYKFFCIAFLLSFIYYWIPGFFFNALSMLNWPTWFAPELVHLTNITGSKFGLGLNPLPSLDWNVIGSAFCLTIPFYTYANQYLGTMIAFFIILIVYYTNNNWTGYLPINSNHLFDKLGKSYSVHRILNDDNQFDATKYQEYGPPYFSAASLVMYGAHFCLYPFAITYYMVTEWTSVKTSIENVYHTFKDSFVRENGSFGKYEDDPHCKMMRHYSEVPDWWFLVILMASTCCAISCVSLYPTETPLWGILFTITINFIFLIPLTAIASVTGFSFGLNVLVELIVGYTIPNSGLALIILKSFGYNIDGQASNYITDQKMAHYSKIPPRAIFRGQIISTILNAVVALVITNWQLANIEDFCDPLNKNRFSCPGANTFFFSSIQYGEIGPSKVFTGIYPVLKWCFLLGFLLVIPCYIFKLHGPEKITRYFHPTLIIGGFLYYAPLNLLFFTGGLYCSYIFMYYIRKHYLTWWEKYNYILTSALSAGVAFSALMIFVLFEYHSIEINWWGNTITDQGIEGGHGRLAWLDVKNAPDGYIGLRKDAYR